MSTVANIKPVVHSGCNPAPSIKRKGHHDTPHTNALVMSAMTAHDWLFFISASTSSARTGRGFNANRDLRVQRLDVVRDLRLGFDVRQHVPGVVRQSPYAVCRDAVRG